MFQHAGNYPKMSGKGAEVKDFFLALHHDWKEHYNPPLRHHMFVDHMLHNQCEVQHMIAHHKDHMLLPDDDAIHLAHHVDNVLVKYSLLANWADKEGHVLFDVVPKHHDLCTWANRQNMSIPESWIPSLMKLSWELSRMWHNHAPMAVMHTEYISILLRNIGGHCILFFK